MTDARLFGNTVPVISVEDFFFSIPTIPEHWLNGNKAISAPEHPRSIPNIHFSFNKLESRTSYRTFHFLKIVGRVLLHCVFSPSHQVVHNFWRSENVTGYKLWNFKRILYQYLETCTTIGHKQVYVWVLCNEWLFLQNKNLMKAFADDKCCYHL